MSGALDTLPTPALPCPAFPPPHTHTKQSRPRALIAATATAQSGARASASWNSRTARSLSVAAVAVVGVRVRDGSGGPGGHRAWGTGAWWTGEGGHERQEYQESPWGMGHGAWGWGCVGSNGVGTSGWGGRQVLCDSLCVCDASGCCCCCQCASVFVCVWGGGGHVVGRRNCQVLKCGSIGRGRGGEGGEVRGLCGLRETVRTVVWMCACSCVCGAPLRACVCASMWKRRAAALPVPGFRQRAHACAP